MVSVAAIVLNWRGSSDTIECVKGLLAIDRPMIICVVDNDSRDGSLEIIEAELSKSHGLVFESDHMSARPLRKASYGEYTLLLVQSGRNGGYSSGNNVGIDLVLDVPEIMYFWILNNDILVPSSSSLDCLLQKMDRRSEIGICGSTVAYSASKGVIQARGGGEFLSARGRAVPLGWKDKVSDEIDEDSFEARLSYVNGAAMFIRREVFEQVGTLAEDYFLYYEELDLANRMHGKFSLGYAANSLLYHKVGASIGTNDDGRGSALSSLYLARSRLLFLSKFYPKLLFIATLELVKSSVGMVVRGNPGGALATIKGATRFWQLFIKAKLHGNRSDG